MKLTSSSLVSALCWSASVASAASGSIYTYQPDQSNAQSRSISPIAARLVLAQRAGVEGYHSADLNEEEVINAINDFGTRRSLFSNEKQRNAFILLDNVKEESASIPTLEKYMSFHVDPAPSAESTRELYFDLARQNDPRSQDLSNDAIATVMAQNMDAAKVRNGKNDLLHRVDSASDLEELFLYYVKQETWTVTAMVMPLNGTESSITWGTYEMPGAESPLRKRQHQKELPLEMEPNTKLSSDEEDTPVSKFANSSEPLRGILPACFSTKESCEKSTRGCMNHGKCDLKYTNKDVGDKSPAKKCFVCKCSATVKEDSEGRKSTTNWGGPACQKKDVSVQFWLIALFTVGMVFTISFAIGTIWTMGSEELPSVIGAGVSGPVKRS